MGDPQCHFDDEVPVHVRRDDRPVTRAPLRLTLTSERHAGGRRVVARLTDPMDYLFLLIMFLGEAEYAAFKAANCLHFDFAALPGKLVEQLRLCALEGSAEAPAHYLDLSLHRSTGQLAVMHSDSFGERRVVALDLQRPGDEEQKRYLAERAKLFEDQCRQLHARESALQAELDQQRAAHSRAHRLHEQELADLRTRLTEAELGKRAEAAEAAQRYQAEATQERLDIERRYDAQVRALTDTNRELNAKATDLGEARIRLEAQLREATRSLELAEEQQRLLQSERDKARDEAQATAARHSEAAGQLDSCRAKLIRLEEKVNSLEAHNKTLAVTLQGKAHLEAAFEDAKAREAELRTLLAEADRRGQETQEFSRQMTDKMLKYGHKWKQEGARCASLEQQLKDLQLQVRRTDIDMQGLQEKMHAKDAVVQEKEDHIRRLQGELAALQEKLSASEKANQWMSNKLNAAPQVGAGLSQASPRLSSLMAFPTMTPSSFGPSPFFATSSSAQGFEPPGAPPSSFLAALQAQRSSTFTATPAALMRTLGDDCCSAAGPPTSASAPLTGRPLATHPQVQHPPLSQAAPLSSYIGMPRPRSPPEGPSSYFAATAT